MKNKKKSIVGDMWRTIQMWLVLRELKKEVFFTANKEESKQIRQGKSKYVDKHEFAELIACKLADKSLYQPDWIPYGYFIYGHKRIEKDLYHNLATSLIESLRLHDPSLIESMSKATGKKEDKDFIRTSVKGDEFCSKSDFIIYLFTKYKVLWAIPITPNVAYLFHLLIS